MKKIFFICCILIATSFFITSCKEDVNGPHSPVEGQYFSTKSGSRWIFSNYHLYNDDNNNPVVQELSDRDTLSQLESQNVLGQNAIMLRHRFVNPISQSASTANYAMYENVALNQLFVNSDFLKIFLPDIVQIFWDIASFDDNKWYKLADGNAKNEWMLDSFELTDASLPLPGLEITLNGFLKFGVKRNSDTLVASYSANTYTISVFFEGKVNSTNPTFGAIFSLADKVKLELMQTNFYLSSGKGLVGIYSPIQNMTATTYSIIGQQEFPLPFAIPGFDKRLIDINIK